MITADTITDEQIRELRDVSCECRPSLPIESDEHAAIHDCDIDTYDQCVTALEAVDEEAFVARARCAEILNNKEIEMSKRATKTVTKRSATSERVADNRLSEMIANRRWCYWIPDDAFVEGRGYRVSIVFESEPGHYPTGDLDESRADHREPWFWGNTLEEARECAASANLDKLGLTPKDAAIIIARSMSAESR